MMTFSMEILIFFFILKRALKEIFFSLIIS